MERYGVKIGVVQEASRLALPGVVKTALSHAFDITGTGTIP